MVVIEAFACGVPVVTVRAKYNAAQGLVENGVDGLVVEPEDREIAKAIQKIIRRSSDYERSQKPHFRRAKDYNWEEIVENITSVYKGYTRNLKVKLALSQISSLF